MRKQYCYVIACTDGQESWQMVTASSFDGDWPVGFDGATLEFLLREGWMPVRETAMGGTSEDN
jgi:hypothetical protein